MKVLKKINHKKILLSLMLAVAFIAASFSGYNFQINKLPSAYATEYNQELSLITNNTFSNYSAGKIPYTPVSWNYLNPTNTEIVKAGIINTYEYENWTSENNEDKGKYGLTQSPGIPNKGVTPSSNSAEWKHLMINSPDGYSRAGYESSSFTLSASSYYKIELLVKTEQTSRASIYLNGLSVSNDNSHISSFSTNGQWDTYTLFIETNDFNDENISLQLWLGGENSGETSTGSVFFNEVRIMGYSKNTFEIALSNAGNTEKNRHIALNTKVISDPVDNANFEQVSISGDIRTVPGFDTLTSDASNNSQVLKIATVSGNDEIYNNTDIQKPLSNNSGNNNYALFMQNKVSGYQGIESSEIKINKQSYYKISLWAKSDFGGGSGATLRLIEKLANDDTQTPKEVSLTTATSETTNKATNNWTKYSFYIESHPTKNTVVALQLMLGTKQNPTEGYVFIDNIEMQELKYSYFSSGSSKSNSTVLSYNTNNNQFLIANGNFNLSNNEESQVIYPLAPRNWTHNIDASIDKSNSISGIVSTKNADYQSFKDSIANSGHANLQNLVLTNPGLTPLLNSGMETTETAVNNILMIGNPNEISQSYTSENITLSASGYYKVEFTVNSHHQSYVSGGIQVKINSENHTVFEESKINTSSQWKTYYVYIATQGELNVNLEIGLLNSTGVAYFDNIYAHSINETEFRNSESNTATNSFIVNYTKEEFNNYSNNNPGGINTPHTFEGTYNSGDESSKFGIIDTQNISSIELMDVKNPQPESGKNVLIIQNLSDSSYTVKSKTEYTFESGNYYKLTVKIKTQDISQSIENAEYDSSDNIILPGASIKLTKFKEAFASINTETVGPDQNQWVEYSFYINPSTDTNSHIEISLGEIQALTTGYVFVDSINIEVLEKEIYTNEAKKISHSSNALLLTALTEDGLNETDEKPEFKSNSFDWLLFSSLIMVLAMIIAVVGTMLRKVKFTRKPKIKTTYDRRRTIEIEMDKKERIEFRRNIISELENEFKEIDSEINEFLLGLENEKLAHAQSEIEREEHYQKLKQAIVIEIDILTKNHLTLVETLETETLKDKANAKHTKELNKLTRKQEKLSLKENRKQQFAQQLQNRREKYLKQQEYRKQMIKEEIIRIEREIEEIAQVEQKMWDDYRVAKEHAKTSKQEYKNQQAKLKQEEKSYKEQIDSEDVIEIDTDETSTNDDDIN